MLSSRAGRRVTAWTVLVAPLLFALIAACYSGRPVDRATIQQNPPTNQARLRLIYPNGSVILMPGWILQYPYVNGEIDEAKGNVPSEPVAGSNITRRFNLDDATQIESYRVSAAKIAGMSVLGAAGLVAAVALLIAATSCPTVYLMHDGKPVLAGEAYPGAIFRSIQRDDLLALPDVQSGRLQLRLSNDNPEIQYTDAAQIVLVRHARDVRALATQDGRVVLAGPSQAPSTARDLDGGDVMDRIAGVDDRVWQSDLDASYRAGKREAREGVVATFRAPADGALVLDLMAENTLWMSAVFHRGFAMTGASFRPMIAAANAGDRGRTEAWRAREGVDLRVEVLRGEQWQQVAIVPTPGVVKLREMAVPIGTFARDEQVQVRLTGGFGFWRIGSAAIASVVESSPKFTSVAATSAIGSDGRDQRQLIERADGRYQVLPKPGHFIDLTFELPESADETQTAFLATSGYYNPLPPARHRQQLAEVRRITATEGGLALLGIDMYADNHAALHAELSR